jgi:glycerol-3-phosphate acyltransferase PlsY
MLYPILLDRINHLFTGQATPYAVFAIIIAVVVVLKHWTNIKRLMQGKESKFSFKKSVKAPEQNGENTEGK